MKYKLNDYNGVIIDPTSFSFEKADLEIAIKGFLLYMETEKKGLAWITLPIARCASVEQFVAHGFIFHSCLPESLTLVRKPQESTYVPFMPTHIVGAGAIVINQHNEILVVRDQGATSFNLPGGHVDPGERIQDSIVREVLEETGVEVSFDAILGFTTRHPYEFGKSNIHFICRLKPLTETINVIDTDEIAEAKWVSVESYLADEKNGLTNREIVSQIADSKGLTIADFQSNSGRFKKQEIFMAVEAKL
ncbi:NUDIX domain-containing protein [Pseudomonas syringae]|nr:NUDIX domain-containing protein [Pseudomonas syringae]